MMRSVIWIMVLLFVSSIALATDTGFNFSDPCYGTPLGVSVAFEATPGYFQGFGIANNCQEGTGIQWDDPVNLSILGNVTDGDVVITRTSVFVDSAARPDLDQSARLVFRNFPFAAEPNVLENGLPCVDCTNITVYLDSKIVVVDVTGFSNYSLTGQKDFTIYSDPEPELKKRVYQTIDLGNAKRAEEYACIVQLYGVNEAGEYILVQTNPKRDVQAKPFGNPDTNQPESLGYFPTKNGIANVYFDGGSLAGYNEFEYVAQCTNNSTKLIYEEPMSTRYSPAGRKFIGRGIWLTQGSNAILVIFMGLILVIVFLLVVKFFRRVF